MSNPRFLLRSAVHIFLIRNNHILLLRRRNTGYEDGNYSVIAGHLSGGETIKEAAVREAREEAGITLIADSLEVVGVMHRLSKHERIDWFLAAERWLGEPVNAEPALCDDMAWFSLDGLPVNVIPYIRRGLPNFRQGRWFDSFGWFEDEEIASY
jgi:8-oxo-dGTP pyrophosphatase MutT (NUDIX family)